MYPVELLSAAMLIKKKKGGMTSNKSPCLDLNHAKEDRRKKDEEEKGKETEQETDSKREKS